MEVISTLESVQRLVGNNEVRISDHGWNKLETDDISLRDVVAGLAEAVVVEDYPDARRGPSVLVLQQDPTYKPVHILWGIPKGHRSPAVLVTAYRPDPSKWDENFLRRKP